MALWLITGLVALSAAIGAQSSPPPGTAIAVSSFAHADGVVYFDRQGTSSTLIGLRSLGTSLGSPSAIANSVDNDALVITASQGVWVIDKQTGQQLGTSIGPGGATWGCYGEAGDFYTTHGIGTATGEVWRHPGPIPGPGGTRFATPGGQLNAMCWNGSTGGLVTCEFGGSGRVSFIARDGTVTRVTGPISNMSGADWSPWDDCIYVSRFGQFSSAGIVKVAQDGSISSIGTGGTLTDFNNSVEVREGKAEELLGGEFGGQPQHLTVTDPRTGMTVALHTSQNNDYGPSDACYYNARHIWASGQPKPGSTLTLNLSFPERGGDFYQVAMSRAFLPSTPLPNGDVLHLHAFDPLFFASIALGPPVFNDFAGRLDSTGRPVNPPALFVPDIPELEGLRVYFGAVTFNGIGITDVSNCFGEAIAERPCRVSVTGPRCICKGRTLTYTATGAPAGGTYSWAVTRGNARASIVGPNNRNTVQLRGDATSAAADDVTLEATYTVGGRTCKATVKVTIIDVTLSFKATGNWDAKNAVPRTPAFGDPKLGPVRPGNPAGTVGFYKNIQIKGIVAPCVAGVGCSFDFKRERQGRVGVLSGGTFTPDRLDCPPPKWCDDDGNNADEDLVLDAPPDCSVYVVDSPGWRAGGCTNSINKNTVLINCLNFREWLEVDGQRCSADLKWYAATRIKCDGTSWSEDAGGNGNRVGTGTITCGTSFAPAPPIQSPIDVGAIVRLLSSASIADRLTGQNWVVDALADERVSAIERAALIDAIAPLAEVRQAAYDIWPTPMLALRLLGVLEARERMPVLFDRLTDRFPTAIRSDADRTITPAARALARLGESAVQPILSRAARASDGEWDQLANALRLMPRGIGLRLAGHAALSGALDARTTARISALLR